MNFCQGILAVRDIASTLTKTGDLRAGRHGPATHELTRLEGNRRTVHAGDRTSTWFSAEFQSHFLSEGQCRRAL